jgi:uncharacterized membrane protein YhaH (DUF805 family)
MTFADSIKYCFNNYVNFNGRASRSQFWYFVLFTNIVSLMLSLADQGIFGTTVLSAIWFLAVILPQLAVGSRRLHDTGKSGWLQLLILIPCVGIIILIVFWATATVTGPNAYGSETI